MPSIHTIIVPMDFSASSLAALDYAAGLAQEFGAKLELVHAWQTPPYVPAEAVIGTAVGTQTLLAVAEQHAQQQLAALLTDERGRHVSGTTLRAGDPVTVILEVAQSKSADLVVMGTRGRGGLSHLLMGSVAERVVRHAHCAVLTVHHAGTRAPATTR
jgi:nucleotide-binding universal stress UspA family protein